MEGNFREPRQCSRVDSHMVQDASSSSAIASSMRTRRIRELGMVLWGTGIPRGKFGSSAVAIFSLYYGSPFVRKEASEGSGCWPTVPTVDYIAGTGGMQDQHL